MNPNLANEPPALHPPARDSFIWKASIKAALVDTATDPALVELQKQFPNMKVIDIFGTAIDNSVNKNRWAVDPSEHDNIAAQFNSGMVTLRANHGFMVEDVKGRIKGGAPGEDKTAFHARIMSSNEDFLIPVLSGAVDHVSIQADPVKSVCAKCGKSAMPFLTCKCKDTHVVISGIKVRELSIVADPAYENTSFRTMPMGFASMVDAKVQEVFRMTEDEASKKAALEAAMKAEEEKKKAEEEKKAQEEEEEEEKKKVASELASAKAEIASLKAEAEKIRKASRGASATHVQDPNDEPGVSPNQNLLKDATSEVFGYFARQGVMPNRPTADQLEMTGYKGA